MIIMQEQSALLAENYDKWQNERVEKFVKPVVPCGEKITTDLRRRSEKNWEEQQA